MGWELTGLILIGVLIGILLLGLPVSFTFLTVVFIGNTLVMGPVNGPSQFVTSFFQAVANFNLSPIPLFILTGDILYRSGLAVRAINGVASLLGSVPARLSYLAVVGGTLFGAISGSTIASTAVHSSLLLPEMRKQGYSGQLSFGPILAGGGLAMIIPPSALAVVYAATANISVAAVLVAGILPGILMALGYCTVVTLKVLLNPDAAPKYQVETVSWNERMKTILVDVVPVSFVVFAMVISIVFGVATPTESAAFGVVASIIIAAFYRKLTWRLLYQSVLTSVDNSGMIFFITVASIGFSRLLGFTGVTSGLLGWVSTLNIPHMAMIAAMLLIVIILGMFMDQIAIMMITIPIFAPIVNHFGYDPVVFSILMLICLRMGLISPPFGLELFIMKSYSPHTRMNELWAASVPFIFSDMVVTGIIMVFPVIAFWLPRIMGL
ncbi:MAG: TRAP transporter large permease [Peptococcaceae bacterium]|nr:TRAP transporter large permease [Peptococcaceae bacterium]